MIATIHQPQYLPWLGYFDKARRAEIFIILDNVQFKKNDWQNRNRIKTAQGWQWLTVPVLHDFGQKIIDVRINNQVNWKKSHLKALILNYNKAPFFENYIGFFDEIYAKEWDFLGDLNIAVFKKMIEWFGIKTQIVRSSDYQTTDERTQRLIDLCKIFQADCYLSGIDGTKYAEFDKLKQNNIHVEIQDFKHPVYKQLWNQDNQNFISHLSAIDLLFNHGPESINFLSV